MLKSFEKFLDWYSDLADNWDTQGGKFAIYTTIAVVIGGLFELIPPFFLAQTVTPISTVKPYNALELAGRDIYQREGCFNCHTQMIRPFKWEVDRFDPKGEYGKNGYSKAGEYVYEHPFLWGSKRTGPDLAHEASIRPSAEWHERHLKNPRETSPGSLMPAYPWLFNSNAIVDVEQTIANMKALAKVGVPYTQADYDQAPELLKGKREGDALIAYLLRLGRDSLEAEKGGR